MTRAWMLLACVVMAGCDGQPVDSYAHGAAAVASEPQEARVIRPHEFQPPSGPPSREVGQLAPAGQADCLSGMVINGATRRGEGRYFCTNACPGGDDECPGGWTCAEILPGAENRVCHPPPAWNGAVAHRGTP
jgi:hypothetical protein